MSDTPNPSGLSYGRKMREQTSQESGSKFDHKKTAEHVAQVLGFVANQHKEAIIHDMTTMIARDAKPSMDGYVLALVRCMEHELAWHCISAAYQKNNKAIPDKYYQKFNRKRSDDESPPSKQLVK